ncbi:MAG: PfkB family carbohydrate kinase [Actinomycetota bacterium]|nr:PfkB family carbohydrate kinase [Actinomycetota bacterium]
MSDTGSVFVFAPAPFVSVTVEQLDGEPDIHFHAGGQGFWVARMIASLEVPTTLCGSFGGETGQVAKTLIEFENVQLRAVHVAAPNPAHLYDRRSGERETIVKMTSRPLSRHEVDELYSAAIGTALGADVCVLAGSLTPGIVPPEFYRRLAGDLQANERTVIADLSGEPLHAALDGGLDVLKIAHDELQEEGLASSDSVEDLVKGAKELQNRGAAHIVVSRADQPALALIGDEPLEICPPRLEPMDPHGAGDSMTAGIAAALARRQDMRAALRLGAAAGALNVTRRGLGTGPGPEIERMTDEVSLRELDGSQATSGGER